MEYKLAKELEDAGFKTGKLKYLNKGEYAIKEGVGEAYAPTLAELIDACGEDCDRLMRVGENNDMWIAHPQPNWIRDNKCFLKAGKTPEIAVARLYLALNENTNTNTL